MDLKVYFMNGDNSLSYGYNSSLGALFQIEAININVLILGKCGQSNYQDPSS